MNLAGEGQGVFDATGVCRLIWRALAPGGTSIISFEDRHG